MATTENHHNTSRLDEEARAEALREEQADHTGHHFLNKGDDTSEDDEARRAVNAISTKGQKPLSELRRFAILTAASFAMVLASTSYAFNLFSGQLQSTYHFKFRDMSNINTVGMCFAYFLMPYGFLYDYFGPLPIYIIAVTYFTIGALLMGLTFQGVLAGSVVKFCVYNAFLSLGSQLFDLASVVTVMSVFPTRKGWVIALLKTLMGLGQAVIGSIKTGFFATSPANYFYFLIALVVAVAMAVMLTVRLPKYHMTQWQLKRLSEEKKEKRMATRAVYLTQQPPMWHFYLGVTVILILVVYLPLTTALLAFCDLGPHAARTFAIVAVVLTCCLLLMMVPVPPLDRLTTPKSTLEEIEDANAAMATAEPSFDAGNANNGELRQIEPNASQPAELEAGAKKQEVKTDIDYIAPQYQTTFLQSCCTIKFWCIFWTMFCGLGSEFVVIFNARYIYAALDGKPIDDTVSTLLTVLNGAGSALGRLAMSVFEAWTAARPPEKRIPITVAFFVPTAFLIISVILFLVLPGRSLLVAYAIAAIGNGFCASITILVLRTLYAKDPAKHYNFGINSLVPAAILINRLLFGEWYAVQADKLGVTVCYEKRCVLMPLVFMIGLNCSALLSNVYVHYSYMRFCRKVLAERRRIREEEANSIGAAEPVTDLAEKPHVSVGRAQEGELYDGLADSGSNSSSSPRKTSTQ